MPRKLDTSRRIRKRAEAVLPGGVNSPVRAFKAVGGEPPIIVHGRGSRMWDADGNEYIDYVGSWGPLILGHAAPQVLEAVIAAAAAPVASMVRLIESISASSLIFVVPGPRGSKMAARCQATRRFLRLILMCSHR